MKIAITTLALLCVLSVVSAQDIPLGEWRVHASYNEIRAVDVSASLTFAASSNGVLVFDQSDKSYFTYSKLSGLSGNDISAIAY